MPVPRIISGTYKLVCLWVWNSDPLWLLIKFLWTSYWSTKKSNRHESTPCPMILDKSLKSLNLSILIKKTMKMIMSSLPYGVLARTKWEDKNATVLETKELLDCKMLFTAHEATEMKPPLGCYILVNSWDGQSGSWGTPLQGALTLCHSDGDGADYLTPGFASLQSHTWGFLTPCLLTEPSPHQLSVRGWNPRVSTFHQNCPSGVLPGAQLTPSWE